MPSRRNTRAGARSRSPGRPGARVRCRPRCRARSSSTAGTPARAPRAVPAVVEVPELRALPARVPLAELVAQAEHALLGAGLLLVAARAPEDGVEAVLGDRVEQRHGLQRVPAAAGGVGDPSPGDRLLHVRDDEPEHRARRPTGPGRRGPPRSCGRCPRAAAGTATRPGQNAFTARWTRTIESLPPLNSSTGRSNSPATSRRMCTASDSSRSSWVVAPASRRGVGGECVGGRVVEGRWRRSASSSRWHASSVALLRCAGRTRSSRAPPSGPPGGPRRARPRGCRARSRSRGSRAAPRG